MNLILGNESLHCLEGEKIQDWRFQVPLARPVYFCAILLAQLRYMLRISVGQTTRVGLLLEMTWNLSANFKKFKFHPLISVYILFYQ